MFLVIVLLTLYGFYLALEELYDDARLRWQR
jgi:hypothetical protein